MLLVTDVITMDWFGSMLLQIPPVLKGLPLDLLHHVNYKSRDAFNAGGGEEHSVFDAKYN